LGAPAPGAPRSPSDRVDAARTSRSGSSSESIKAGMASGEAMSPSVAAAAARFQDRRARSRPIWWLT
jgi:hypothetical protein